MRLRTVSPSQTGWTRRRVGSGFVYLDEHGARLAPDEVARIKALVIPPAWQSVWISPHANGHIQAVGLDARGRKQYLYHEQWRIKRDLAKHDRVLEVASRLPSARKRVAEALALPGMPPERALATAFRLLDLGYFRIGSDSYASENGSYGLTTLLREHVRRVKGELVFSFVAKSGVEQHIRITDPVVLTSVETMRRRRGGEDVLLAYKAKRAWTRIGADDVNAYLKELLGAEVSAKDFRTWHGTVHAAHALAILAADTGRSERARKRAVAAAMIEVASHLGNTPTVARKSYVDGRLIQLFHEGVTIEKVIPRLDKLLADDPRRQATLERAVLKLLRA